MTQFQDDQFYALTTLLPLILYAIEETQCVTVRPASPDGRFGQRTSAKHSNMDLSVRVLLLDEKMRERWQIDLVEAVLFDLFSHSRTLGMAVWYEYVDQWTEYEVERRVDLAREGLEWMVGIIREDLVPYSPDKIPKLLQDKHRDRQIKKLKKRGWTVKRIATQYGLTPRRVRQILFKRGVADGPRGASEDGGGSTVGVSRLRDGVSG